MPRPRERRTGSRWWVGYRLRGNGRYRRHGFHRNHHTLFRRDGHRGYRMNRSGWNWPGWRKRGGRCRNRVIMTRRQGRIRRRLRNGSPAGRFLRLLRHESHTGNVRRACLGPSSDAMITVTGVTMRVVNIITEDTFPVPWAVLTALRGVFLAR